MKKIQYPKLFMGWLFFFFQFFVSFSLADNQKDWRDRLSIASLFTSSLFQQSWSPLFFFLVFLLLSFHCGQGILNTWVCPWWGLKGKHWHFSRHCYVTLAPVQSHLKSALSSIHFPPSPIFLIMRLKFSIFLYGQHTVFLKWDVLGQTQKVSHIRVLFLLIM